MTGQLELELLSVESARFAPRSDQEEERAGVLTGVLHLDLPEGGVQSTVQLAASASLLPTSTGPILLHTWGTLEADLNDAHCQGSFGWSYYYDPYEAGGSLSLRCDDGAVLGGRITIEQFRAPGPTHRHWEYTAQLIDGHYVPSS